MRQRCAAFLVFVVLLQAVAVQAWAKPAPTKAAPPPPPPPPPSAAKQALDAARSAAAIVTAKIPGLWAKSLQIARAGANSSLLLLSHAAAVSNKAASAVTTALTAAASSSKFSAPTKALAARLVHALQKPALAEPLALVMLFASFSYLLRSSASGAKLYARAALCSAFVNWLSFSFIVDCVTTAVIGVLTSLEMFCSHPLATLCLCLAANASELRRVAAFLPARRKRAIFAPAPAVEPEPAAQPAAQPAPAAARPAAPVTAPAARISTSSTPDASKMKPTTPLPGAPKTSPAAAASGARAGAK